MNVLQTVPTSNPERAALQFSAILAVDRGVPSALVYDGPNKISVVADDGRAIQFILSRN